MTNQILEMGDSNLSIRKKTTGPYAELIDAFWISCSIETKHKLESFFVDIQNYEVEMFPMIVNGSRPFSIYEFTGERKHVSMLIITRFGIDVINKLCRDLPTKNDIQNMLLRYFTAHLKEKHPEKLNVISKLIPLLASNYYHYRNKDYPYNFEMMNGRYICILYPLSRELSKGVNAVLNQISLAKEDDVLKERIFVH